MAERVQALCEKYELPFTTGSLFRQYSHTLRPIWRLALPERGARKGPEVADWAERGGPSAGQLAPLAS